MKDKPRTIGDFIRDCMSIHDPLEAERFFESTVAEIQAQIDDGTWESAYDAITAARMNIGWCFGEGMPEADIDMWANVTGSFHPIFRSVVPSPEQAFAAGQLLAGSVKGK